MRVLVSDPISEQGLAILTEAGLSVDVKLKQDEDQLVASIGEYEAMLVRSETKVTRRVIEAADRMLIIGRAGVGVDNIDVEAATEKGIIVVNSPEGNTIAATEHTMGMMLALARNIPRANQLLKQGVWDRKKLTGVELRNKVLGILGLGKIGAEVAKRARAMEMYIVAYDPYINPERAEQMGVELAPFEEVLRRADFLTVHLPLTKETRHLIGDEQFAMMKPGVRVLNVARGGIYDEEALYRALQSGHVAGAAIDVFEQEPTTHSPLFELDTVVVTPHLGASTEEAQINVAIDVAEDILRLYRGEPVRNAVNLPSLKPELRQALEPYLELVEKLGSFLAQVAENPIREVILQYNGELANYDLTSLSNVFLQGLLKASLGDAVNYVNAPVVARKRGLRVQELKSVEMLDYANLITATIRTGQGESSVAGTLLNLQPRIIKLDGYSVDVVPRGHILVVPHVDKPRIIGPVGNIIGAQDVNIAGMQVGRQEVGGKAVMLLNIDGPVSEETRREIARVEGVLDVKYVCL